MQAKSKVHLSIEGPVLSQDSPIPSIANIAQVGNSPKRPLEDSDTEGPPRKVSRADSPLKGAAGRRLETQKKTNLRNEIQPNGSGVIPPPMQGSGLPIPPAIWNLLSMIPRADFYPQNLSFDATKIVELIRNTDISQGRMNGQMQMGGPPGAMGQMNQMPQMPTQYAGYGSSGGNNGEC